MSKPKTNRKDLNVDKKTTINPKDLLKPQRIGMGARINLDISKPQEIDMGARIKDTH